MATTVSIRKDKPLIDGSAKMSIADFQYVVGDILADVLSLDIFALRNFNAINHAIMEFNMYRNPIEKERILEYSGSSAYDGGNPDNHSEIPYVPSYAVSHSYLQFSDTVSGSEKNGYLTTYTNDELSVSDGYKNNLFNRAHYYWDLRNGESADENKQPEPSVGVYDGDDVVSRNSILYKTRKLFQLGKIKTIVSQFHTDRDVRYNGQVASNGFGESHGRNLLRKEAELANYTNYNFNGFDNPYCRVWTHHYQYDRLEKTMRANKKGINTWGKEFEWTEAEKRRLFPTYSNGKSESDDENYAYAWRGYKNQKRREEHSVLDTDTGLLKIAPKRKRGEGDTNIHPKDCMFSIENLAWRDYDPYSFTQALSWEQRGPFGGRIMWFPPYGITFTESSSVNWNSNDFIGRGEKVYTYVNTERSGNLSFYMITDHPSSIDYSSWYENTEDSENDYLRYFAGCMEGDTEPFAGGNNGNGSDGGMNVDNIHELPTYLTDEYINGEVPPITSVGEDKVFPPQPTPPELKNDNDDKNPRTIEFFVFFPNNYSGVNDAPVNRDSAVNSISYLLCGRNAQKYTKDKDTYWDLYIDDKCIGSEGTIFPGIGYEMTPGGITTHNCIADKEYIIGGYYNQIPNYVPDENKKWCYRIDHILTDEGDYKGDDIPKNTICQELVAESNFADNKQVYGLNRNVSSINDVKDNMASKEHDLYSFLEVACALHKVMGNESTYNYLYDTVLGNSADNESKQRVGELIDMFEQRPLKEVTCKGMSTSHGDNTGPRNTALAENRARTVLAWLRGYEKWSSLENSSGDDLIETAGGHIPNDDINSKEAKLYRCAHCVMTFSSAEKKSENETDPIAENVVENSYFAPVQFWSGGTEYTFGDYVQYKSCLYEYNAMDVFNEDDVDYTLSPEASASYEDISETIPIWQSYDSYNAGDIVNYNGVFYKAKENITGATPKEENGCETKEFPNFVELTDAEIEYYKSNNVISDEFDGQRVYYKRKSGAMAYQSEEMPDDKINTIVGECGNIWYRDMGGDCDSLRLLCEEQALADDSKVTYNGKEISEMATSDKPDMFFNKLRYDQEYYFFRKYLSDNPLVEKRLQEKIQHFNPVFHSMTPEGFNARLTFLQQCTRQGMTKTMGDTGGKTANNLAFGRPPYCVLRIGDFYNQMIVIENITFDYSVSDGITWDLNTEGNGVQPMLCKVNISFKFIGGGDITGPVQRLQNAMTFNYYANTSFYDNRADRVVYETNDKTMGGAGHHNMDLDKSYAYTPKIFDDRRFPSSTGIVVK